MNFPKRLCMFFIVYAVSAIAAASPPRVLRMFPENGDRHVKPGPIKIRILFDQEMDTRGHSICGGGENFPEFVGAPQWSGKRSFSFAANLKPNHEYTFGINCPSAKNFKNIHGEPAEILFVRFKTAGDNKETASADSRKLTPQQNRQAADTLLNDLKNYYSYNELRGVDWDAVFKENKSRLLTSQTPEDFAYAAVQILAHAKDKHIWLTVNDETIPAYVNPVSPNVNFKLLPEIVPNFKKLSEAIYSGQYPDGIGYILIDSWSNRQEKEIEPFFAALGEFRDAPGLIIDVRGNGGGSETLARQVAGCFIKKPVLYAKNTYIEPNSPGGFGPVHERFLQPNKARPRYEGKVAVLTGPVTISSCEAFVLMMKQVPGCITVGAPTQGSSGNPKPHDLGNGVTVYLPSWKALLPDGTCFEGKGIKPDIPVPCTQEQLKVGDPILAAALRELRKP